MTTEIEQLPRLLARAVATLEKATTAAEILEAREAARFAYDAAKATERLAKMKDAHDIVIAAIRKAQADALIIETRAQCRLADEYDAAQERGEVKSPGNKSGKSNVPDQNNTPTVTDIGLTRKQIHEARQVRDAEKAKPGAIRHALDQQLEAGKEPTRADVKRAIGNKQSKGKRSARPRLNETKSAEVAAALILDQGKSYSEMELQTGLSNTVLRSAVAREEGRRDTPVTHEELSMSAQKKLDIAIRQHKRKLELQFERHVLDEVRKRIDEIVLPSWKRKIDEAQELYKHRRGAMDKTTFNKIRRALHPDSRQSISDKVLADAFDTFMGLEKYLLNEKDSPTDFPPLPKTWQEWENAKRAETAARKARRMTNKFSVARK